MELFMVTEQTKITTDIIIHTNQFASSFGDQLCAYMTGELPYSYDDDDFPGQKEKDEFKNDSTIPAKMKDAFIGKLEEVEGEYGTQYIETIPTPGWFNHGMGKIYEDTAENEIIALADYKKVMTEYAKDYESSDLDNFFAEIEAKTTVDKYGSEQGIWITFEMQLDKEHLDFLKKRAYEYAEVNNIQILSFEANEVVENIKKTVKKLMV
jgi:hypothetical protein